MGNPPYSGASENSNAWTERLLKTELDGAQSYYTIDGKPLGERTRNGYRRLCEVLALCPMEDTQGRWGYCE